MTESKLVEMALFEAARDLSDPSARRAFLDLVCRDNPPLRRRLEKLLAAEEQSGDFFNTPVAQYAGEAAYAHASEGPGGKLAGIPSFSASDTTRFMEPEAGGTFNALIDRYRVIKRLGEGGCGVVYLAEQQVPVRRKVALKIIRLGMDTERVIARFAMERQTLALMNHPHIAQVLDAGATESGRLYFVMELVQGERITDFCDRHRLGIPQRLDLFAKVCMAIQHAHQKGIIHRDIKPSNILIAEQDGVAIPKVIDFGIAKAFEGNLVETTMTSHDQFIGTPAYMSPEQAESWGRDVDTRSDVYSLGALLYELLAGRPPFNSKELAKAGVDQLIQTLKECEPPRPSRLLASFSLDEQAEIATRRQTDLSRLLAMLQGDLDWIVMKAMEKDPQRRYVTVNGLTADVGRSLRNEAVSARPPSRLYQLRKLVRRNRAVFIGATAVVVSLAIGLGASIWFLLQEQEALRRETRLRTEAEKSGKLAQAAFLTRENNLEAANNVLKEIGKPPARPSLDGVTACRTVGEWLVVQQRWREAADRYAMLMEFDQLDIWGSVTIDYQAYGVLLLKIGDVEGYKQFCLNAGERYAGEQNGDASSRILKTCLLQPTPPLLRERLQPMGKRVEDWFGSSSPAVQSGWAGLPACLWWFRMGDTRRAEECARAIATVSRRDSPLYASGRLIYAMAAYRNGNLQEARRQLSWGRAVVQSAFQNWDTFSKGSDSKGYWYDWVFAEILLGEAEQMIAGSS